MTDFKFDILNAPTISAVDQELETIMQVHVNSGLHDEEQLAEIRKREANNLKNKREREKQEEEERKRQQQLKEVKAKEEKNTKKVVLGEGETANEMIINADAEKKSGSQQYDYANLDYNKLYTNNNPLYSSFRHDTQISKYDTGFWELEEDDALEYLREKFPQLKFEETEASFEYRAPAQPKGKSTSRYSTDAIRITARDGSEEIIELDHTGYFQEGFGGWDVSKIENYNKLANFLDTHLTEKDIEEILKDDETRAIFAEQERIQNLEPTEEEYQTQITKKELLSTDIFNEKTVTRRGPGMAGGREITLEYGGYEKDVKEARKQLIKENREKAAVSNTAYTDPTEDEIKERALLNLQNEERRYLRTQKYDTYMNELEDFEDWGAEWVLKRAKDEGVNLVDDFERIDFQEKIRKEMKEKYYQLKVAGNDEEAKAVLDYRKNELLLKNTVNKTQESDVYKRFNQTTANIQNLNHKYERNEKEVELENGKIIPLHVWEQYIRDQQSLQLVFNDIDDIMKITDKSIEVIKDESFKWNMIKRNYNDWERTQEVLGYNFANLGMTAIYGVPKLLTFGQSGGDDEAIRWKEVVDKNRQSFRKDVEWDRAFEDGNFGRFMAQSAVDQIPIYATLATGNLGLGILGGSVFGDKWAEMTMEERASNGIINHPTWKKWFKSLGYAASEIVLDWAITVPIMRSTKNMIIRGKGKAMIDNSMKGFVRQNAARAGILSPALESVSEGATQSTQNMIDGRPILENVDHASFLGLTMGMGISYTGFTGGLITSQFSDHKSMQEVRSNITEMQMLFNINADLKEGLKYDLPTADRKKAKQQKKDNEARIKELLNENNDIINKVNNNIKDRLTPKAYREFVRNESRAEEIKVEAQKILDSGLDQKTIDKRLKILLAQFNMANAGSKHFRDSKSFGSRWAFVINPTNKEQEGNLERLKDLARTELQNEGKQEPDEKKVLERARYVWAKEQARESNAIYKRTKLARNYTSFETIDEAVDAVDRQIQEEIDIVNANNQDGSLDNLVENLEKTRKLYTKNIKSGKTYGLAHVDIFGESMSLSIIETQAKAERFETRTHEGGHQVFWNALQASNGNEIFTPMANQIIEWTKNNDEGMYKRIMLRTGNGQQGAAEIVSVFLEEVGDGKFDIKKNKGFTNLWGLMSNDAITKTTGKDFEFDFAGETDVMNFLVTLGKKIKDGTLTKADERAIRKSELLRSFVTKESVEKQTGQFSQDASNNVQNIYDTRGVDGAFDIIEQFKPITTRIANRYRDVPGYNQELVVSEIEIGERGILDLIRSYKPESEVPLAAYINTYLPSRSIEAANRVLKEQFTEDITERVDIIAEETDVDTKPVKRKKRIIVADRLGVNKKVASAIRRILPDLNIEKLNFKNLKNLIPDITGELFGISPKKIVSLANLTKGELQSAQMFISKNADLLIQMLPEGATASGTATGVPNSLLKAFYTKADRAKMAKTGSKAGLAVQQKNKINRTEFLEVFGIIDGKPVRTDRNTSARVLALANVTGKMITNQAVRIRLAEGDAKAKEAIGRIKDGKSTVMFSADPKENFKQTYQIGLNDLAKTIGYGRIPMITKTRKSGKTGELKEYSTRDLNAPLIINNKETGEIIFDGAVRVVQDFLAEYPQYRNLLRSTLTGGFEGGLFLFAKRDKKTPSDAMVFDEIFPETNVEQGPKRKKYTTDKFISKGFNQDFLENYDALTEDQKLDFLLKFFKSIETHLKKKPSDAWLFIELIRDTSKSQNTITRILAPFKFYPVYKDGGVINDQKVTEEHTDPQNLIGKSLLASAMVDKVDFVWQVIGKSYMQGPLLDSKQNPHDTIVNKAGYKETMPDIYYELIVPRLLNEELKLPNGYASIVRLAVAVHPDTGQRIDLGMYFLPESNMTITEFFKVDNIESIEKQNELIVKQLTGEVTAMFSREIGRVDTSPLIEKGKTRDKAVLNARSGQYSQDPKGITVLDFDDTLATTKSLVKFTRPDGTIGTLNAEQYASTYEDLLDQGFVFDFSDFNKVVKGKVAPLFKKALKLQKKFGPKNMFVLTARPPAAAKPIYDFLKANGLNIPLKNITGLANSTSEAKALWIADKVSEGYNDFYFADDALQNVQAVKNMLNQFDVKSKVQQAKLMFSQDMDVNFNNILETTTGIESQKRFSDVQAKLRGKKSKYKNLIPPSAQDFMGLIYNFIGKGAQGDKDIAFFKKALVDPFARGINELNASKQSAFNDLNNLFKEFKGIKKKLRKKVPNTELTQDQAVRVYLWNKYGFEIPGISKRDLKTLTSFVENNNELKAFAETLSLISKRTEGYKGPNEYWIAENIQSDFLSDGAIGDVRSTFLQEWIENKNIIFSKENLNKIEAIYGSKFREALEDILYRMETGSNRPRGANRLTNVYMNWTNNSVGAIMFFNLRSAVLQTISATNYINWSDNNPLKAGAAIANQPQYWKDFAFIFNSDMLKQRRRGNQRGVNEAELMRAVVGSTNPIKAGIAYLLNKGFLPTQIADSFAISAGGATFYRNRIKTYLKQGMSQKEAEAKAWLDFQEITEVSQQSARPDLISQQQANPLGRLILAFQNTPMQYGRIMNKAVRDIVNRRGDTKTHISKIVYYGAIQAIIFNALQSALWASLGDEDEEQFDKKKSRIMGGMIEGWLSAFGYGGKAVGTLKRSAEEYLKQRDKGWNSDHAYTLLALLGFSPPIGSKLRKIYSSIKTEEFNRDIMLERGFTLDNPLWQAVGYTIEGITNIPLGAIAQDLFNLDNAMDSSNEWWQRLALVMGWNTWDLGIKDPDLETLKLKVKEQKKQEKKIKQEERKKEKQRIKESKNVNQIEHNKRLQEKERKEGKEVKCAAISKSGNRCKNIVESGSSYCTIHAKVKQNKTGKKTQCKKIKKSGKRCKMQTSAASGYCYYHD